MARDLGVVGMDVDSLDKAGERYQQDTGQRQLPEERALA